MNAVIRPAEIVPQVVPMTVEALRTLDDQGFFADDCDYELIEGVLEMTPPPGSSHNFVESRLNMTIAKAIITVGLDDTYVIQTGGSFRVGDHTLLGPDLILMSKPYAPREHTRDDILVIFEVAWSSRERDMGTKAKIYARAGIVDYWVLDVPAKSVIVHRNPDGGAYLSVQTFQAPATIAALLEPRVAVAVADLF